MARFSRFWLPPVLYGGMIFALSSMSRPPVPFNMDFDILHYPEYAILAFLLARAFYAGTKGLFSAPTAAAALFTSAVFGFLDELHQAFVPQRVPDVADFLRDVAGALAGLVVFIGLRWAATVRKRKEN